MYTAVQQYLDQLKATELLTDLNWQFGAGHLVYLGDAFDGGYGYRNSLASL